MRETENKTALAVCDAQACGPAFVAAELKKLARHSSHYFAGLLGSLALGLVSFPIFTRVFSVAEFGRIDLVQRIVLLLVAAGKMGLQNAALRFYDARQFLREPAAVRRYYSTMFLGVISTSTGVALLFLAVTRFGGAASPGGSFAKLIYFIAALALLRAVGSVLYAFLRIEERTKAFNAAALATRAATVAAVCALLPWTGRVAETYFTGATVVETGLALTLTLLLVRRGAVSLGSFDRSLLTAGIAFGLPLVVYESAFTLLGSADRFLVQHYLGANALGFYSVAYGLAQHANELLVTPLSLALIPIYMRLWTSEGGEKTSEFLSVTFNLFLLAAAAILAVAAATAPDVVLLLASPKYRGAERLIPALLGGLLVYTMHVFLAAGLLIHKRSLLMACVLTVSAGFNIGLNCLLLPRFGLMGGAIAMAASYGICMVWLGTLSHRLLPLRVNKGDVAGYAFSAGLAWLAGSAIRLEPGLVSLAARSATAVTVFGAALLLVNRQVRVWATRIYR